MTANPVCTIPSEDDLRAALAEMKTYMDVTETDLRKIYEIALRHARHREASRTPVREIMKREVVTVTRTAALQEAARLLSEHRISGMPVVDSDNRVAGVISEADVLAMAGMRKEHTFKDILRAVLGEPASKRTAGTGRVEDAMSAPPITCSADDEVGAVAAILDERRIKRLPVVDADGKLLGIISRADIVRSLGTK